MAFSLSRIRTSLFGCFLGLSVGRFPPSLALPNLTSPRFLGLGLSLLSNGVLGIVF